MSIINLHELIKYKKANNKQRLKEQFDNPSEEAIKIAQFADLIGVKLIFRKNSKDTLDGCVKANNVRQSSLPVEYKRPLYKELKTMHLYTGGKDIFLHFRGQQMYNEKKVRRILKKDNIQCSDRINLASAERLDELDVTEGKMSPFMQAISPIDEQNIVHIFDDSLFEHYSLGEKMMTNAGCEALGIEFYVEDVFKGLQNQLGSQNVLKESFIKGGTSETLKKINQACRTEIGVIVYGEKAIMDTFREFLNKCIKRQIGYLLLLLA